MIEYAVIYRRVEPALRALLIVLLPPALGEMIQYVIASRGVVCAASTALPPRRLIDLIGSAATAVWVRP